MAPGSCGCGEELSPLESFQDAYAPPTTQNRAAPTPTPGSSQSFLCHPRTGRPWSVEVVEAEEPPVVGGMGDLPSFSGVGWDWPQIVAPWTLGAEEE